MKKTFLFIMGLVESLSLSAQKVMRVEMNDGSVAKYSTADIKQITFEDAMLVGSAVDLGLPSGTLWADINVGAQKPEDTGNYYGWGETVTHDSYSWEVYTLWDYDNDQWISWGEDSLDFANSDADVAHVQWGGEWRTPSKAQFEELKENCTWSLTTQNGMKGYLVTGKNDNSIFMPFNGVFTSEQQFVGSLGNYWSSTRVDRWEYQYLGCALFLSPDSDPTEGVDIDATAYRYYGYGVRPVIGNITTKPQMEAVDMALPSGTKWASMNIGATAPEEAGNYYAWGETETKDNYSKDDYAYYDASTSTCSFLGDSALYVYYDSYEMVNDTDTVLSIQNSQYDVATKVLGDGWMMPSASQFAELMNYCIWTYTTQNGVTGFQVTATNGNSIFLPSVGTKNKDYTSGSGKSTYYWTSDMSTSYSDYAIQLSAYMDYGKSLMTGSRWFGCPVRAVCK